MNDIQRGVLNLIRSAITGEACPLPDSFQLSEAENLIVKHQIVGLVYEGAVLCGIPKNDPTMEKLFPRYYQQMIQNNAQMTALKKLYAAFEENGIDYLPVKGCVLKELYPKPAMRTMGDADILIRMEQYDTIKELMQQLGYTEGTPYYHELPWQSKLLHVELHNSLIPSYHTIEYNFFANVWERAVCSGGHRYDQPLEDAFLYVFAHYAKHYRAGGIGIRQLVDVWLWHKAYPSMDMAVVQKGLEQLQFSDFYTSTMETLQCWFEGKPAADRDSFMTDYIFSSGSFGSIERHNAAQALRDSKRAGSLAGARWEIILRAVFPSLKKMKSRYPILEKQPWLLPFLWPVRWVTTLLFRRSNIRKFGNTIENASNEKIQSFEQALDYVGLTVYKGGKID